MLEMHNSRTCDMEPTTSSSRKRRVVVDVDDDDDVNGGFEYDQQEKAQEVANTRIASDNLIQLDSLKFLRVLLVEFDDSTRSIIAALLRKSGYRVVSVPDGLKAWETLKGKPQTIDLVLAEVELPSICGFSLLSMIMGDESCSNIPVIMMSSYDEVNVVFKCMLKGAADFLVKPVRKNELRNLWQHVWRRHSVRDNHKNGISSQLKTEPTDETSSTKLSNHCAASLMEMKEECNEKRSDAQSSCSKPHVEDDLTDVENRQNMSFRNSTETSRATESVKVDEMFLRQANEVADKSSGLISDRAPCNQTNYSAMPIPEKEDTNTRRMSCGKDPAPETQGMDANISIDNIYENDKQLKPLRVAMDLIGSFDNHLHICKSPREVPKNTTGLELSLRRSQFSDNEIQEDVEMQKLKHSDASAFSRYDQTTGHPPLGTESKETASVSCKNQEDQAHNHIADVPQQGVISVPRPTRGTKVDGLYSGLGSAWPQLFYTPVGPLPLLSSNATPFQEAAYHVYSPDQSNKTNNDLHHRQSNSKPINAMMHEQQPKVESFDGSRYVSAAATQSVTSSLCNSSSNLNSSGCGSVCDGSNGIETAVNTAGVVTEHGNEVGAFMPDGCKGLDIHCLSQREAALNKFRLKRKDRCFDKKVRYQSRKKLAEQRPRVKGQFVRQIPS